MDKKIEFLLQKIIERIELVKQRDAFLFIPPRVYEPAISHKLAEYLQPLFPKYDVDVEYDKYGTSGRKELENFHSVCTDNSTDRIRPDILVHQRGIKTGNLFVLEIKDHKAPVSSRHCVDEKLKRLTDRNGPFGYSLGILWLFGERTPLEDAQEFFFYVDGKQYRDKSTVIKMLGDCETECRKRLEEVKKTIEKIKEEIMYENAEYYPPWEDVEEDWWGKSVDEILEKIEGERSERTLERMEREEESEDLYDDFNPDDMLYGRSLDDREPEDEEYEKDDEIEDTKPPRDYEKEEAEYEEKLWLGKCEEDDREFLEDYKKGELYEEDFFCESLELNVSEERKQWENAWRNVEFLSANSLLSDHLLYVKIQKWLLDIALEKNPFAKNFNERERKEAESRRKFLEGWIKARNIFKKCKTLRKEISPSQSPPF